MYGITRNKIKNTNIREQLGEPPIHGKKNLMNFLKDMHMFKHNE